MAKTKRIVKLGQGKGVDQMHPFRGKRTLTEREVNLLKTRLNRGKILISQLPESGYALSPAQRDKGVAWLRAKWRTLGVRELAAIGYYGYAPRTVNRPNWKKMSSVKARLIGFWQQTSYEGRVIFNYPIYRMTCGSSKMDYYVKGGEVNIVG